MWAFSSGSGFFLRRSSQKSARSTRRPSICMRGAREGDRVLVEFLGTLDDGSEFGRTLPGQSVEFTVGSGAVIRGFDSAVRGLRAGEERRVRIPVAQAYGAREPELVTEIPAFRVAPETRFALQPGGHVTLDNGLLASVLQVRETGEVVIDANHCLAGKALTFQLRLVGFSERRLRPVGEGMERAFFALGSFWKAELAFKPVSGVISTCVGFAGGTTIDPSYMDVASGATGHAETVAVDYDPNIVSYETLVEVFWKTLGENAFSMDQPGNNVGSQYRSVLFCTEEGQSKTARRSRADLNARRGKSVATEVTLIENTDFWIAEKFHQRYLEKNENNPGLNGG